MMPPLFEEAGESVGAYHTCSRAASATCRGQTLFACGELNFCPTSYAPETAAARTMHGCRGAAGAETVASRRRIDCVARVLALRAEGEDVMKKAFLTALVLLLSSGPL